MWSRKELKTNAKAALKNFFWKGLVAIILVAIISSCTSWIAQTIANLLTGGALTANTEALQNVTVGADGTIVTPELPEGYYAASTILAVISAVLSVFLLYPLTVGLNRFFEMSRGIPTSFGELFTPLKKCVNVGLIMLWMEIKVCLWSLLFIIPGIIKTYEYSMVPYILAENPGISSKRAFQISKAMTKGHKWNIFVLQLSFILWIIGTVCTCGLLGIYLAPYFQATFVEAYYKLKAEAVANGAVTLQELPDVCLPAQPQALPFDNAASAPTATTNAADSSNVATAAAAAAVATAVAAAANNSATTEAAAPVQEAVEEAVEAPAEEPAEEPVEAPAEEPAEAPAEEPAEAPAETPAE